MKLSDAPIGVFDSGMGGLTVLNAFKKTLPNENYVYLGDTARLPYGTKSLETVQAYALQAIGYMIRTTGIKALVIACNTATTAALSLLQVTFKHIPIIGVIEPGAHFAERSSHSKHILVLATEATLKSQAYQHCLRQINRDVTVLVKPCPLWVPLAEEGCINNDLGRMSIEHYLHDINFNKIDTLLLGCTHFPVFKKVLSRYLGMSVKVLDGSYATAHALSAQLDAHSLKQTHQIQGKTHYWVTDNPERFLRVAPYFIEHAIEPSQLDLIDIPLVTDNTLS